MVDPTKVRSAIERALKKNPEATPADLRKVAVGVDKSLARAAGRSFNARYVVPVKRKLNPKPQTKRKARRATASRSPRVQGVRVSDKQRIALRELILKRDREVLNTLAGDDPHAAYALGTNLDSYIEEIVRAARK